MDKRMSIMLELQSRKESTYVGTPCPSCGLDNKCAIDAGHSANLCWCFDIEGPADVAAVVNCYCKNCLENGERK